MTFDYQKSATIPQILINKESEDIPIGRYGCELLKNLKANYPYRYWELNFNGELMKKVHSREIELMDLKMMIMEELEKKFPRPKTKKFIKIASHMAQIDELAEDIVKNELIKAI